MYVFCFLVFFCIWQQKSHRSINSMIGKCKRFLFTRLFNLTGFPTHHHIRIDQTLGMIHLTKTAKLTVRYIHNIWNRKHRNKEETAQIQTFNDQDLSCWLSCWVFTSTESQKMWFIEYKWNSITVGASSVICLYSQPNRRHHLSNHHDINLQKRQN